MFSSGCLVRNMLLFLTRFLRCFSYYIFKPFESTQWLLELMIEKKIAWVCACVCNICAHTHTHAQVERFYLPAPPLKEICRMWWAKCSLVFFFPLQVFGDYYHFRHRRVVKRSLSEHRGTHIRLHTEPQVCVKCKIWIRLRTALSRHFSL